MSNMETSENVDHFNMLEEKVNKLIAYVTSLRQEKALLQERIDKQSKQIAAMTDEMETLRAIRDGARERVVELFKNIEQLDI